MHNFKTTASTKRSLWAVIFLFALASLSFGIWHFNKAVSERQIRIIPEVSLEMVALLTEEHSAYPPEDDWKQTLLSKLPDKLAKKLPLKWQRRPETHINWSLTRDRVMVLLKFNIPKDWLLRNKPLAIRGRIEAALKQAGISEIYLKYPGGYESERRSPYVTHIPKWGANGTFILEGLAFQVPANVDSFDVTFAGSFRDSADISERATITLRNPIKGYTAPLTTSVSSLPAASTHDGVTVTLRSLQTRSKITARGGNANDSSSAGGTTEEPSEALAVFEIADTESTPSQWAINDPVDVSFGNPEIEFNTSSHTTGKPPHQATHFQIDFGVLKQPVKLTVPLTRISNFPAEEQIIRAFPLPKAGTHTEPGEVLEFWDGPVTVFTGNKVSFTGTRSTIPSNTLSVMVSTDKVQNRAIATRLHGVQLTTPGNGTFNLMPSMESQSFLTHWYITDFSLERLRSTHSLTVTDLEASTLTVTVTRPREFSHKFQFTAIPTEAQ